MPTIDEIRNQIKQLEAQAEEMLKSEYKTAVTDAQALITKYSIKLSDLKFDSSEKPKAAKSAASTKKLSVKYRDSEGNAWSGRGLTPKWLRTAIEEGKDKESFRV